MQTSRARLLQGVCRSRNPFTPSVVLWKHFVAPNAAFGSRQRLSSLASPAAETGDVRSVEINGSVPASGVPSESIGRQAGMKDNEPSETTSVKITRELSKPKKGPSPKQSVWNKARKARQVQALIAEKEEAAEPLAEAGRTNTVEGPHVNLFRKILDIPLDIKRVVGSESPPILSKDLLNSRREAVTDYPHGSSEYKMVLRSRNRVNAWALFSKEEEAANRLVEEGRANTVERLHFESSPESPETVKGPLNIRRVAVKGFPQGSSEDEKLWISAAGYRFMKAKKEAVISATVKKPPHQTKENTVDGSPMPLSNQPIAKVINPIRWTLNVPPPPGRVLQETKVKYQKSGDYNGSSIRPIEDARGVKETAYKNQENNKNPPWYLSPQELETLDPMERLQTEISRFADWVKPSKYEQLVRKHVTELVKSYAQQHNTNMALEVFGSERTGLAFATSDIDLRLTLKGSKEAAVQTATPGLPPSGFAKKKLETALNELKLHLRRKPEFPWNSFKHLHARYPLIAFSHNESALHIQVVCSNDSSHTRSAIAKYTSEHPYMLDVYRVVKAMLDVRGLSDVFHGGFGSYPVFMMIVASLQQSPPRTQTSAAALLSFLEFWSAFDTSNGLSIEPGGLFDKIADPVLSDTVKAKLATCQNPKPLPPWMLSLRDPADPTNDLGRKALHIKHLQATCKYLLLRLTTNINTQDPANAQLNMLEPVVGPIASHLQRRKNILTGYGKQLARLQDGDSIHHA